MVLWQSCLFLVILRPIGKLIICFFSRESFHISRVYSWDSCRVSFQHSSEILSSSCHKVFSSHILSFFVSHSHWVSIVIHWLLYYKDRGFRYHSLFAAIMSRQFFATPYHGSKDQGSFGSRGYRGSTYSSYDSSIPGHLMNVLDN